MRLFVDSKAIPLVVCFIGCYLHLVVATYPTLSQNFVQQLEVYMCSINSS